MSTFIGEFPFTRPWAGRMRRMPAGHPPIRDEREKGYFLSSSSSFFRSAALFLSSWNLSMN
jgi:hypothetical protein